MRTLFFVALLFCAVQVQAQPLSLSALSGDESGGFYLYPNGEGHIGIHYGDSLSLNMRVERLEDEFILQAAKGVAPTDSFIVLGISIVGDTVDIAKGIFLPRDFILPGQNFSLVDMSGWRQGITDEHQLIVIRFSFATSPPLRYVATVQLQVRTITVTNDSTVVEGLVMKGKGIVIYGDYVTVRNCDIQIPNTGIAIYGSHCQVYGNRIEKATAFGILIFGSHNSIRDNVLWGNAREGVCVGGDGIHQPTQNEISYNKISWSQVGIGFYGGRGNIAVFNKFENCAHDIMDVMGWNTTTVESSPASAPAEFRLEQNYPNPFNPSTSISYSLAKLSNVSLTVYDLLGNEVAQLVNEVQPAGKHTIQFDGSKLASGVYFYSIKSGEFSEVKKMMLLK